jgi:two-component system nitrate/nitrite response regulator NarL
MRTTRVVVLHPHRIVGEALARRLDSEPDLRVVELCATPSAVRSATNALAPDVAVLAVDADDHTMVTLTTWLVERDPAVRVVAVLGTDDPHTAVRAIRAGASGVLTKDSPTSELVEAAIAVMQDRAFVAPPLLWAVLRELRSSVPVPNEYDERLNRLTPREHEVLTHLMAGHDRATIASRLQVSVDTVRTHTRNILAKLEVHSSLEAVSIARRAKTVKWRNPASPALDREGRESRTSP